MTLEFHKGRGISLLTEQTSLAPQERPASTAILFNKILPMTMTARSKALTVSSSSNAGIASSSSTHGTDGRLLLSCACVVLCN
jgi:hypothetical protein